MTDDSHLLQQPPIVRRGSMASVRSLEDLLTCPIHMELLEDARSLPCGHVFCRPCLDQLVHNRGLECPICRAKHQVPPNGAAGLPAMYTQNRIVQYITEKKQDIAMRSLQGGETAAGNGKGSGASGDKSCQARGRNFSITTKTDLLKRLVEEISSHESDGTAAERAGRRVCIEELNTLLQTLQRSNQTCTPANTTLGASAGGSQRLSDSDLTSSSIVELHSVDHQRRMMHRRCLYKREVKVEVRPMLKGLQVSCVDFLENGSRVTPDRYTAVILDATKTRMFVLSHINGQTRFNRFEPRVGAETTEPMIVHYLQCLNGCVHICAEYRTTATGSRVGMMLQCDISGRLLSRSPLVTARDDLDEVPGARHPPICGFYYDHVAHEYLVTRPSEGKISLWADDYRSKCDYNFDCHEAHPYYVVRVHDNHEVWMSCPTDKIIVILDEVTNVWKKLDTAAIYNSVPGHLTITTDGRIIFVDVREQRLFWMTRMGNNLPVQRLIFRGVNLVRMVSRHNQHISCIRGLTHDRLMLATEAFLFVFRPGGSLNSFECCML